ncbi:MAG: hypothetical protein N4J56_002516 [Chroococcidiopsis sp. SAG 2025]|uniref:VapE domain-containing protein n=1 Tax=Chroococcidiopsis sp. SAG 2025 TaxID=171389 RepID=UPI0029371F39|nr:VapE domain-containing protein [Chroococcidiopsis sp. SAG 2025]MDV2992862.1 hypothetical protein [Chroococcidiopsis sp. SAG 2025]
MTDQHANVQQSDTNPYNSFAEQGTEVPTTVHDTIYWVLDYLKRPPLPENPKECQEQLNTPGGKQPCWLDSTGKTHTVSWKRYQEALPDYMELEQWFSHSKGIGTLGGWNGKHYIGHVDFDYGKTGSLYATQEEMLAAINQWKEKYPVVKSALCFKTPSGGYRFIFAFEEAADFAPFVLDPDYKGEKCCGELLARNGGHTLLPPTVGVDGIPYEWVYFAQYPPVVKNAASVGLYPKAAKFKQDNAPNQQPDKPKSNNCIEIQLEDCLSKTSISILKGKNPLIEQDRSAALAKLLNDAQGWINFLEEEGFTCVGSLEQLAEAAWNTFPTIKGDGQKWERILSTINPDTRPAAELVGGREACLRKIGSIDDLPTGILPVWTNEKAPQSLRLDSLFEDYYEGALRWNFYKPECLELKGKAISIKDLEVEAARVLGRDVEVNRLRSAIGRIMQNPERCINHPQEEFKKAYAKYPDATDFIEKLTKEILGLSTPLELRYVEVFLLGWCRRIFEPGCKHDTVFILISEKQGRSKSSFFQELAGFDYFTEIQSIPNDKDGQMVLARNSMIEFGEIDCMFGQKANSERKQFLTKQKDCYRKPYDTDIIEYKRPLVFVGTTNKVEILSDITGDRRYHPVHIMKDIDLQWLKENRELLLAEVYRRHLAGENNYLTKEEEELSQQVNLQEFTDNGLYYDQVVEWMNGTGHPKWNNEPFTLNDLLLQIGLDSKSVTKQSQMEVSKSLKVLGFKKTPLKKTFKGKYTFWWYMPKLESQDWLEFINDVEQNPQQNGGRLKHKLT